MMGDGGGSKPTARVELGDCRELLRSLPDASIDAVVTDPPYPHIKRRYGTLSEPEWHALMAEVCLELRRVLKPSGSAVIVLQPTQERLGRMRLWVWDFLTQQGRAWNLVQDVYWWRFNALPGICGATRRIGLLRASVKVCAWLGDPACYRNQDAVLWTESDANKAVRHVKRSTPYSNENHGVIETICDAAVERGGVTPFNLIPLAGVGAAEGGSLGHPSATPLRLCSWWVRYISPPGGLVLDPFAGSGTTGVACIQEGRSFIGFEQRAEYVEIAQRRLSAAAPDTDK